MVTAMHTPSLKKVPFLIVFLYTNRFTADQSPISGAVLRSFKKITLAVLDRVKKSILRSVKRQQVHNSIGVKNTFFGRFRPKVRVYIKGN